MWNEVTEDDVLSALNEPETIAYQTAVIRLGQQVLPQITKQVVNMARGRIGDCSSNTLAPGMTLPERVLYDALALIRFRLMTRIGLEVSEDRRKEQRDALAFFKEVARCEVAIEPGDGTGKEDGTDSQAAPSPGIKARKRRFTREQQNGI